MLEGQRPARPLRSGESPHSPLRCHGLGWGAAAELGGLPAGRPHPREGERDSRTCILRRLGKSPAEI